MLGRSRWGEGGSPGSSHRPLVMASGRHRAVYEQKKFRSCRCTRRNCASIAAGVRSNTFMILPFFADKAFRRQQRGPFKPAEANTSSLLRGRGRGGLARPRGGVPVHGEPRDDGRDREQAEGDEPEGAGIG